jgi:hypothetical protein
MGNLSPVQNFKDELLSEIQHVFQEKNLLNDESFDQFLKDLHSCGWII